MTEIDALKYELKKERKAFDKLHKRYMDLLKQQRELEKENKELRSDRDYWKKLAQALAKNNGNVKLKDEHLAWRRVDVE